MFPTYLQQIYLGLLICFLLGHYSSAFTMDTYAAVSEAMRADTQNKLEQAFQAAKSL